MCIRDSVKPLVSNVLFSKEFILIFILTSIKSFSCFFYEQNIKEIGNYMIEDDLFITKVAMFGAFLNFLMRFSIGKLYKIIGIKMLYAINMILEMIQSLVLIFYGKTYLGFTIFIFIWRTSFGNVFSLVIQGMHFILSYISCSKFWGPSLGNKLMKYYNFHLLVGNFFDVIALYMLPGEDNFINLAKVCFFINFIAFFAILKFLEV